MTDAERMSMVLAEVQSQIPTVTNMGITCRRPINYSGCDFKTLPAGARWSQHAWGNAVDIGVPNLATGDQVERYLIRNRKRLGLGSILWRVPNHYDHLHVEGSPRRSGNPPGGSGSSVDFDPETDTWTIVGPDGSRTPATDPSLVDEIDTVVDFLKVLVEPETYLRVLWFSLGTIGMIGSVVLFARELGVTVPIPAAQLAKAIGGR